MPSWRSLRTSEKWFTAADLFDLKGERHIEIDVEVLRVEQGEADQPGSDKKKKLPALYCRSLRSGRELPKPLGLNVVNGMTIENIVGTDDYKKWPGTKLTLFVIPDARFGRERRPAIRIRPTSPNAASSSPTGPSDGGSQGPSSGPPVGPANDAAMSPEEIAEIKRREAKEKS